MTKTNTVQVMTVVHFLQIVNTFLKILENKSKKLVFIFPIKIKKSKADGTVPAQDMIDWNCT